MTSFRFAARLTRHLRIASGALVMAVSAATATPTRVALNAPTCAQEMENYRRVCEQSCGKTPMASSQCLKDCNDPKKLLPRLKQCEERQKPR